MEDSQRVETELSQIESLLGRGRYREAASKIEELESRRPTSEFSLEQQGRVHHLNSRCLRGLGETEKAQAKSKEALETSKRATEAAMGQEEKVKSELTRGIILFDCGEIDASEERFWAALAVLRDMKGPKEEIGRYRVDAWNELARVHFVRSEYDSSLVFLDRCIGLSEDIGYEEGKLKATVNRARVYLLKGHLKLAEKAFISGIEAYQRMDNEVNLANGWLSLGYTYCLQETFDKAKEALEKGHAIIVGKGLGRVEAIYHEYSGVLASAQGDFASANKHYDRVLKMTSEGDMASQTHRLRAELRIKEKKYDEATSSCETGLEIAEKIGETEKALSEMMEEMQKLSMRPVAVPARADVDAPIPLKQDAVLDQLTLTELDVLGLIEEMGEGSVPQIKERIGKGEPGDEEFNRLGIELADLHRRIR